LRRVVALVGINLVSVLLAYGANQTDRELHGLKGAVGSVRIEAAKLSVLSGKIVEGQRVRTEKRVYDDKGNLNRETLYNADSVAASKYYSYYQMNVFVITGGLPKNASQERILSGQATKRVEPVYPVAARAARVSGSVAVELTVDDEGDVLSARVISGHPLLREAALDAAWDWKFSPTLYRGKAVKVIGAIEFNFHL
jgi:TonB family protein